MARNPQKVQDMERNPIHVWKAKPYGVWLLPLCQICHSHGMWHDMERGGKYIDIQELFQYKLLKTFIFIHSLISHYMHCATVPAMALLMLINSIKITVL